MQKGKPRPQLDRRQSNMEQLESAILQRFQDINKRKNDDESDEDNEDSSSDMDSDWAIQGLLSRLYKLFDDNLLLYSILYNL